MTDKERELRELALTRWDDFVVLVGLDVSDYEICIKRKEGKSVRQIARSVAKSKSKVHRICQVCP